jgi:hypothetical protein
MKGERHTSRHRTAAPSVTRRLKLLGIEDAREARSLALRGALDMMTPSTEG